MATTLTTTVGSGSTDKFSDFENGVYDIDIQSLKLVDSTKYFNPDGTPKQQVEFQCCLPDATDDEGKPITSKVWLNAVLLPPNPDGKTENARKGSHLWRLIDAVTGRKLGEGEDIDLEVLISGRFRAYCDLNDKGYPRIKNDTIASGRRAGKPAAAVAAAVPARTVFVDEAPAKPAPPRPRPVAVDGITASEQQTIRDGWRENGYGDETALADWVAENFGGRTLAQIQPGELDGLREALGLPAF